MIRYIALALIAVLVFTTTTYAQTPVYSVNCGGAPYKDVSGRQWIADTGLVTKGRKTLYSPRPVTGTTNVKPYLSERWCDGNCNTVADALTYEFTVTDGDYLVKCHFAEFYQGAFGEGLRTFNVIVNGKNQGLVDVFKEVGAGASLVKSYNVTSTAKKITIAFQSVTENAKINAIEVLSYAANPPTNPPPSNPPPSNPPPSGGGAADPSYVPGAEKAVHRINCGADADYTDKRGQVWAKDRDYYGGTNVDRWTLPFKYIYAFYPEVQQNYVENTFSDEDAILYTNERWSNGEWGYKLQVPKGKFLVRLYFAEWYMGNFELFDWNYRTKGLRGVGTRVFAVQANGQTVIPKVDAFQSAGPFAAVRREFWVTMAEAGTLDIKFMKIAESPMCNALEVIAEADVVPFQKLPTGRLPGLLVHYYNYLNGREQGIQDPMQIMPKFENDISFVEIADYFNNHATIGNFRTSPFAVQFAAQVRGYLRVPAADTYRITLESNDGSNMRICDPEGLSWAKGECILIGNDGNHQNLQVTREIEFKKPGFYRIEVDYFQGQVLTCLRFFWMRKAEFDKFEQYYYVGHAIGQDYFSYDPTEVHPVISIAPAPNAGTQKGGTTVTLTGAGFSQDVANTWVREIHPCLPAPGYKQIKPSQVNAQSLTFTTEAACYGMGSLQVVILKNGEVFKKTNEVQFFFDN